MKVLNYGAIVIQPNGDLLITGFSFDGTAGGSGINSSVLAATLLDEAVARAKAKLAGVTLPAANSLDGLQGDAHPKS